MSKFHTRPAAAQLRRPDSQQSGIRVLFVRGFASGVRAAARLKPVIALKVGRFQSGSKAAMSHTGAIAGADAVFQAALRRAGVVRVDTVRQLFAASFVTA